MHRRYQRHPLSATHRRELKQVIGRTAAPFPVARVAGAGCRAQAGSVLLALAPMLAMIGPLPGPETEGEYAYETLWNGMRVIAHLPGNGSMRLLSQTGLDVTAQYPELQGLPVLLPRPEAVLDGEIITLDSEGRPSVGALQQRMSLHHPGAVGHAVEELPVKLMLYDILYLGEPTVRLPYTARRDLLDDLAPAGPAVSMPAAWPAPAGQALEQTRLEGYDGVVAKRLSSPYLPGRRSRDWIKIKHLARR
jgi:ATP-dependent DNA ligase